jgi:hypothetical protein
MTYSGIQSTSNETSVPGLKLPKGAYRVPTGGFVVERKHMVKGAELVVSALHKENLDLRAYARVLFEIASNPSNADAPSQSGEKNINNH